MDSQNIWQPIRDYIPQDAAERAAQIAILQAAAADGEDVLLRERTQGHITCSGFVMNPTLDKVLMVYHNIYDSYAWTGGHADGSPAFLETAIREVQEETGIKAPFALMGALLSLDCLPVKAHVRRGVPVAAHMHYNLTYGLIAEEKERLHHKPDENSDVAWIPVSDIAAACREPHMLPIYEKLIQRMRVWKQWQAEAVAQMAMPLLAWYPTHARDLPWRRNCTPYRVWLSEIMLQQTRVETVKEYFTRFLTQFPDVYALAEAPQEAVNKCWEGLGYYSRAANLRRAAQAIVQTYHGEFPRTYEAVRALPGIGDYTAGAICSICYGLPTPAADGNVFRVLARVMDCYCAIDRPLWKRIVMPLLTALYQAHTSDCATLTQALIEVGATVCLPGGNPKCGECPLSLCCLGRLVGDAQQLPKRTPKKPRRTETMTVLLLQCGEKIAVRQRTEPGLLHGLWEFPHIPGECTVQQVQQQVESWGCVPETVHQTGERRHVFTHVEWTMHGMHCQCGAMSTHFVWKTMREIVKELSLPTAFRQFLADL